MWITTIKDGHGGTHRFENENIRELDWADALAWAEKMDSTVDVYVNGGEQGEIPTSIVELRFAATP